METRGKVIEPVLDEYLIRIFKYILPNNGYWNTNFKNVSKRIYSDNRKFPERYLNIFDISIFKYF